MQINGRTKKQYLTLCPEWANAQQRDWWCLQIDWVFEEYPDDPEGAERRARAYLDALPQKQEKFRSALRAVVNMMFPVDSIATHVEGLASQLEDVDHLKNQLAQARKGLDVKRIALIDAIAELNLSGEPLNINGWYVRAERSNGIRDLEIRRLVSVTQ